MLTEPNRVPSFYFEVLQTLEEIGAPYMIIGGFAAAAFGSNRVTFDIDIVVDLQRTHVLALAAKYDSPRYYADPLQMQDSIQRGMMFNLIDAERGQKVDLVPLSMDARYRHAFSRRIRRAFEDPSGAQGEAWFARPEDVILGKLVAWSEGRSKRHEDDIYSMLVFIYLKSDPSLSANFDEADIHKTAIALGADVLDLWSRLKRDALAEATK